MHRLNSARYPVVVALDGSWQEAQQWIDRLREEVWGFKVGSILFSEQGPRVIQYLKERDCGVFLDLKFHDIPNTVQKAVQNAFGWGADWISVHCLGGKQMLRAAAAQQNDAQKVLAITILTSLQAEDLQELGFVVRADEEVKRLAEVASSQGVAGLVCSPREVGELRQRFSDALLVTPGIRLSAEVQDQKRTSGAKESLEAGASAVVIGRALTESKDWQTQWKQIRSSLDEMS